jgi:hypothetical protein
MKAGCSNTITTTTTAPTTTRQQLLDSETPLAMWLEAIHMLSTPLPCQQGWATMR